MAAVGEENAAYEGRSNRRCIEVGPPLEPVARIGVQAVATCRAANNHGLKPCRFDKDVGGGRGNHGVPAAHDATEGESFGMVGDDKVLRIKSALNAVERLELFAFMGAADDDAAFNLVEVEGVGGLAHRQPCEVGGIDSIGDLLLLEKSEVGGDFGTGEPVI